MGHANVHVLCLQVFLLSTLMRQCITTAARITETAPTSAISGPASTNIRLVKTIYMNSSSSCRLYTHYLNSSIIYRVESGKKYKYGCTLLFEAPSDQKICVDLKYFKEGDSCKYNTLYVRADYIGFEEEKLTCKILKENNGQFHHCKYDSKLYLRLEWRISHTQVKPDEFILFVTLNGYPYDGSEPTRIITPTTTAITTTQYSRHSTASIYSQDEEKNDSTVAIVIVLGVMIGLMLLVCCCCCKSKGSSGEVIQEGTASASQPLVVHPLTTAGQIGQQSRQNLPVPQNYMYPPAPAPAPTQRSAFSEPPPSYEEVTKQSVTTYPCAPPVEDKEHEDPPPYHAI